VLKAGECSSLVLIDFGISCHYINPRTEKHCPERSNVGFKGTLKYASLNAHQHHSQSPRDDLRSWLYSVVELLDGTLPWAGKGNSFDIQDKKSSISDRILLKHFPKEFLEITKYIWALKYRSVVNYNYLMYQVIAALKKVDEYVSGKFDWELLSDNQIEQTSIIPVLPKAADYVNQFPKTELILVEEHFR